jgi:hypothetical protein
MPVEDASAQVLHVAFIRHLQFGRDIVSSYGPWGFLEHGYYPPTYLLSVAAWLVWAVVFIWAGWRLARYFTNNHVVAWLWLTGFTAMASIPTGSDVDNLLVAWGVLLLFLHFLVEEMALSRLQVVLVFILGWFGLVKFTGFMEGALLVAVIALDNIFRHRRFPWIISVWLTGVVFFWLLAGQEPSLLWPFLKNSWALAKGYSDTMNEGNVFVLNPVIYGLLAIGFCVLGAMLVRSPRRAGGFFFVSGMAGLLFAVFKEAYVRDDNSHEMTAATAFLLIALACVAVAATRKTGLMIMAGILFCASISFTSFVAELQNPTQRFPRLLAETFQPDNLFAPFVSLTTDTLRESEGHQLARLRMLNPLPPVAGEADLYSWHQDVLFANGLPYRPRPVIQSHSAYTPELAKMNADWLQTDRAATHLFFAVQVFDARFPSLDDGLSWPELLTRYDVTGISDQRESYLCLTRSPSPRKYQLQPLQEATMTIGKPFAMPVTNGLIWAEMEIPKTRAGKLLSVFYKPAILVANVKLADGTSHVCHIIPGMASAGFLLSPFVSNNGTFLALAEGDKASLAPRAVVSMTLFEKGMSTPSFCYQPEIKIRFYRLEFPAQSLKVNLPQNH